MAIDQGRLLASVLPEMAHRADELRGVGFVSRLRSGGAVAWDAFGEDLFDIAAAWSSDTARGWAAFAVPFASGGVERMTKLALAFAKDEHFAVREWAWLGFRPVAAEDPRRAVTLLSAETSDCDPLVRRFCSEATRPRGVWSAHLPLLKRHPELGEPILEPLATATERYVRDSVGNWLNDAARSRPDWVAEICARWSEQYGDAVAYVCRRGQRGLKCVPTGVRAGY